VQRTIRFGDLTDLRYFNSIHLMDQCVRFLKMAIRLNKLAATAGGLRPSSQGSRGHTRPAPPLIDLNGPGRLRVSNLLALFGISHSTLYARIRAGRFPARDGLDGNIPYWNTSTIRALLTDQK
jgi:predicted DNA-binding transcriptional regulator AlpA